jgi:hypothetical protein
MTGLEPLLIKSVVGGSSPGASDAPRCANTCRPTSRPLTAQPPSPTTGSPCRRTETLRCWWRSGQAWAQLPWSARIRVLRRAVRGAAEPDRLIALTAVGWAHRDLLSSPWSASCAVVLASGAAALVTVTINRVVRRGPATNPGTQNAYATTWWMSKRPLRRSVPRNWGKRRPHRQSIPNPDNATLNVNHNELIRWELGEPR